MTVRVPFCVPSITSAELDAVRECVAGGWLTMGYNVQEFEREFAEFCQCDVPGIAVDSCTTALWMVLKYLGIGPGKVVAVPALTFAATANVIELLGASVKFVDVDITGCMSPSSYDLLRVDCILAVDYAGNVVNVDMLKMFGVPVVVDSAESHGAEYYPGARSGQTGLIHCYSFYPTKIIAGAEGGMIIGVRDEEAIRYFRKLRLHGLSLGAELRYAERSSVSQPVVEMVGVKGNMTDVSAAIARVQLRRYDEMVRLRREVISHYSAMVAELREHGVEVSTLGRLSYTKPAPYIYVILVEDRDKFVEYMLRNGIKCGIHFIPLHKHPYYANKYPGLRLPYAEKIGSSCVSLPLFPDMTIHQVEYVVDTVKSYFGLKA